MFFGVLLVSCVFCWHSVIFLVVGSMVMNVVVGGYIGCQIFTNVTVVVLMAFVQSESQCVGYKG